MTLTIQNAIDAIIAAVPGAPFSDTVDTVKVGDPSQEITGVAIAFLATSEVIEKAVQLGANLVITHEPIFYNHLDATDWLARHPTYQAKRRLIEKSGVVVWRFHDYLHSLPPDSTLMGLRKELGWEAYALPEQPFLCTIPPMTLLALAEWVKGRLGLGAVRVVGDLEQPCETIGLLPGFPPAEMQMGVLGHPSVDVLIAGEIHEWETSEYVRDAAHLGYKKGLIVTGHLASEEPGMKWIIPWLQERLPGIVIRFVPTGIAFHQV
jgi:putative NIF3 family GTP cyclohydrolase 1 type 2